MAATASKQMSLEVEKKTEPKKLREILETSNGKGFSQINDYPQGDESAIFSLSKDIRKELTIDGEGRVFATATATARLAGQHPKALLNSTTGLLWKLKQGTLDSNTLRAFSGFDYWQSNKVPDVLLSAIISYYAYEAPTAHNNTQAKKVIGSFAAIGVRTWIQQELGWAQSQVAAVDKIRQELAPQMGAELVTRFEGVLKNLTNVVSFQSVKLEQMETKFEQRLGIEGIHPGVMSIIQSTLDSLSQKQLPPAGLSEPFTAKEYVMAVHGRELDKGDAMSLGRFASNSFCTIDHQQVDISGSSRVYYLKDLAAWSAVYQAWVIYRAEVG